MYNCEEIIKQYEVVEILKKTDLSSYHSFSNMSPSSDDYLKAIKRLARPIIESLTGSSVQSGIPVAKRFMNKAAYDMIPPESKKGLKPEKLLPFDGTSGGVPIYAVKWFVYLMYITVCNKNIYQFIFLYSF